MAGLGHKRPGLNGYRRRGCRCNDCTLAHQEYREVEAVRAGFGLPPVDWSEVAHLIPGMRRA